MTALRWVASSSSDSSTSTTSFAAGLAPPGRGQSADTSRGAKLSNRT